MAKTQNGIAVWMKSLVTKVCRRKNEEGRHIPQIWNGCLDENSKGRWKKEIAVDVRSVVGTDQVDWQNARYGIDTWTNVSQQTHASQITVKDG